MYKLTKIAVTALAVVNALTMTAAAQSYGSNPTPSAQCLAVDQTVSNPGVTSSIEYVDNVPASSTKYQANSTVVGRIKVKNTRGEIVPSVKITNDMPTYLSYLAGPGTLTNNGRTITVDLGDMQAYEERYVYITYKTARPEDMPSDKSVVCITNNVSVSGAGCYDSDAAVMCIEKSVGKGINPIYQEQLQSVKVAPKAGPEMGLLLLGANALAGAVGFALKRKIA